MKMIYSLHKETDKKDTSVCGLLSVGQGGADAHFFEQDGPGLIAELRRVRIEWAGATVLCISGMEPMGFDRTGREKFRHQVWYLRYIEVKK